MADIVKHILISAIDLAVQVIKASNEATIFKKECDEVKNMIHKLLELLEKAVVASFKLCEFPTRHIISNAETELHKSLLLFNKCIPKVMNRVLTIIPVSTFPKMLIRLERSISDVSWLLNVSIPLNDDDEEFLGPPPFANNNAVLLLIYELMAILYSGTLDDSCEAAKSLGSMANDNPIYAEIMIRNGLCSIFVKILREGSIRAQVEVACATSALVASFPKSQDAFEQHGVIQLLLSHLTSLENPETEDSLQMKAMAAKALRELVKGNSSICKRITDSKRVLHFADLLLEIEDKEVRYNSVMVVLEITGVAEQNPDLRRSAFNSKSPLLKTIVKQTNKLIEENRDTILLMPYITSIGNLARSFRASDTPMIEQLVKLLDHQDPKVSGEAVVTLTKFTSPCNYLHNDHSRAIVEAGGVKQLVELSYLGCEIRIPTLELLIRIAVHVPEKEQIFKVLEWASKQPLAKP